MTYQEKRSYVQFVGNVLGTLVYILYLIRDIKGVEVDYQVFGKYVLLLVPTLIVVQFITKFIFDVFNRTHEKKEEPKSMDELDYMIELKSIRNFCFAFLGGFFLVLLLMWLGASLTICLYVMIAGIFVAGTTIEVSYILYYRKGV